MTLLTDTIRIALSPDTKSLVALTEHGHEIPLPLTEASIHKLHSMLSTKAANALRPAPILAAYTRLPGHGNGKIPTPAKSAHAVRISTPPPSPFSKANPPTPTSSLLI